MSVFQPTFADKLHGALKFINWYSCSYTEAARQLNANGMRTVRGIPWTADNLRAFTRRHGIRRVFGQMPQMVVTIDEPGLREMAIPELAGILSDSQGIRSLRVIMRYIEKGTEENRERLREAIRTDPLVREAVLDIAPKMLDHPWAAPDYQEFLDYARTAGNS